MAARTRSLVSGRTLGESCTVRETVCSETPARRATVFDGYRFFNSGHRLIFLCQRCHWWHPAHSNETPSSISNASPTIRSPPKTYRSPTFLLPRTAFVDQMLTLPLCKHRATGRLKRLRARNRRSTGTGAIGSRLILCRKMATSTFWQPNVKSYHRCQPTDS